MTASPTTLRPSEAGVVPGFVACDGEMAARMRTHDWSASSLGAPDTWPGPLRTVVGIMLAANQPMFTVWGPDRAMLYNDSYAGLLGPRHPVALGRSFREVWPELASSVWPIMDRAYAGEPTTMDDIELVMTRNGYEEETHFSFFYAPLRDEAGAVSGMYCACVETTAKVFAERRTAFRLALEERLRGLSDPAEVMAAAADVLGRHLGVARVGYAEVDAEGWATVEREWNAGGLPSIVGRHRLNDYGPVRIADMRAGRTDAIADFAADPRLGPSDAAIHHGLGIGAQIVVPLVKGGRLAALLFVHASAPRRWHPEEVGVVEDAAGRTWAAVERARAETSLRESEARLRFLGGLDEALRLSRDALAAMLAAAEHLARHLDASRCAYADVDADNDRFVIRDDFTAPGIASSAGTYSLDLFGPRAAADMRSGRTLVVRDVAGELAPGEGREMFLSIGIGAIVCCPLVREGRLVAMMAVHQDRPRDWRADEIGLVAAVVERCWAHVERVGAEARLRELNATLERHVAERTAERHLLASVVESTGGEIQVLGPDYRWLAINAACADAYERIYGMRPRVGDSLLETLADRPDQQAAAQALWARALAGEAFATVADWGDPALDRRSYEMRFEVLRGPDGARIGAFLTGHDLTDRLQEQARLAQAEEALRQAQKMEAVGQLTGGVAHDFNNLLTIIRSSTDLLRRPDLAEERRRRYVDAISDTVERAAKLTGQLLAFARRQALKPEVFDPAERVRGVTDMLRSIVGSRVRIVADIACGSCLVEADATQFDTALVNMAVNARDAMNEEGTLTIRIALSDGAPPTRDGGATSGRFVAVSLADTGHGIPADRLDQVFEPFFTTKEVGKGTGLGLSQVYGFAKQSGGDIVVESEVGQGTTFTLYLPQVDGRQARSGAPNPRADVPVEEGRGRRVLLVEDNVEVGRSSTQVLEDLGYETTWAANADEALSLLDRADGFDVVFSDVVMPGISGIELGREIRRRHPGLPVVLTSGYSHVLAAEGTHGFDLLHKPYAAEELSRILRRVARVRQTPRLEAP